MIVCVMNQWSIEYLGMHSAQALLYFLLSNVGIEFRHSTEAYIQSHKKADERDNLKIIFGAALSDGNVWLTL